MKIYLVLFQYCTDDCDGVDTQAFSTYEKAVERFKVFRTCGWRLRGDTQQCAKQTRLEELFSRFVCLTIDEAVKYAGGENREICGWHISDLKIYDQPKELSEFYTKKTCNSCKKSGYESTACMYDEDCKVPVVTTRPPQSYMRVVDLGE